MTQFETGFSVYFFLITFSLLLNGTQTLQSAELVGFFVDPQIYWKLMSPTVQSAQGPGVLMTLAALMRGSTQEALHPQLQSICVMLADPEVCRSEQVRACQLVDISVFLKT